jgi:gliding motility-associated-like protein
MRKITLFIFLFLPFFAQSQTVSAVSSNAGCIDTGVITASTIGLGSTPQYQLRKGSVVIAPFAGDANGFTNNPVFTGLSNGTYVVLAKISAIGAIYNSTPIIVNDGYNTMLYATPTKTTPCQIGGLEVLTTTIYRGRAPYTYKIENSATGLVLETSAPTSALVYNYDPLPIGNYLVTVTDACAISVTSSTAISYSGAATLAQMGVLNVRLTRAASGDCTKAIGIGGGGGNVVNGLFTTTNGQLSSATDRANFSYRIEYNGVSYGKSTTTITGLDPSPTAPNFPVSDAMQKLLPGPGNTLVYSFADAFAGTPKYVMYDKCGNSRNFIPNYTYDTGSFRFKVCGTTTSIEMFAPRTNELCFPLTFTFTNISNPSDVVNVTQTSVIQVVNTTVTPGNIYTVSYVDSGGLTSGIYPNTNVTIPTATPNFRLFDVQASNAVYAASSVRLQNLNFLEGDIVTIEITASSVPSTIGYTTTHTMGPNLGGNSGVFNLVGPYAQSPAPPATPTFGVFQNGTYTLKVTTPCGVVFIDIVSTGNVGTLDSLTATPICGGFDVVANTLYIENVNNYEIVIVSGPTNVGAIRYLLSLTISYPFNGLSFGTYVFGIRVKGGGAVFNTKSITYSAINAVTVNKEQTGGFVCLSGDTNGKLTIIANSISPPPGNLLEYALSTDGGLSYGPYQTANIFTGLTNTTYFFKVKDQCGNEIVSSAQIGVAANPIATVNDIPINYTICESLVGTLQLDVDIIGAASYLWTGPGINATNNTIKFPVINISDLLVGVNNYSVIITTGAPCNITGIGNVTITTNALPMTPVSTLITQPTCSIITGSVVLGNLPSGNWTITQTGVANNTITGSSATTTINGLAPGTYNFTVTNQNTCISKPLILVINPVPVATSVTTFSYITPVCQNVTGNLNPNTSVVGFSVGGTFSSATGLAINPTTGAVDLVNSVPGSYLVNYSVNANISICQATGSFSAPLVIDPTVTPVTAISYNSPLCNNSTNEIPITTTIGFTTGGTYNSTSGLTIDSTSGQINPSTSIPGNYVVTYTVPANNAICQIASSSMANITILSPIEISASGDCINDNFILTAFPVNNSFNPATASYVWLDSTGATIGGNTASITVNTPGTYTVNITSSGCSGTISYTTDGVLCIIQKGISPNNDGWNDFFDLVHFKVTNLNIFNRYGIKVYEYANYTNEWKGQTNNGEELPDGTYYYDFVQKNGKTHTGWIYILRTKRN